MADFSKDGNKLSGALDQHQLSLRILRRSSIDALDALHDLAQRQAPLPGRKIMLWISPGWPLFNDWNIDRRGERKFFEEIVCFSTDLRRDRITLYQIYPAGTVDPLSRDTDWENFMKAVSKPGQAQPGNLGLQVLSLESDGLVFRNNNDITSLIERCLADARASYEIFFEPTAGTKPNEYRRLEVRLAKPALKARTWQSYYSEFGDRVAIASADRSASGRRRFSRSTAVARAKAKLCSVGGHTVGHTLLRIRSSDIGHAANWRVRRGWRNGQWLTANVGLRMPPESLSISAV